VSEAVAAVADAPARVLSPGQHRFLRYWSLNMSLARRTGQATFPGFSYSDEEWARMDALSNGISTGGIYLWLGAVVFSYIAAAVFVVVVVIGGLLMTVWRNTASVTEPQIFSAIGVIIAGMIGLVMPLSIAFSGLVADPLWRVRPAEAPADAELYAKVTRQFRRMGLVAGVLVALIAAGWGIFLR
jgi:hypothetical protein